MKILVEGDQAYKYRTRRFKCERCGCVFEADRTEYETLTVTYENFRLGQQTDVIGYTCNCPNCGKVCDESDPET